MEKIRCCEFPRSYNAPMFARPLKFFVVLFFAFALTCNVEAASVRIIKVLPHLINLEGRNSVSPSLYERDAYQEFLRKHPEERGGLSFDVQWTAGHSQKLLLRIETRGVRDNSIRTEKLELPVKKTGFFSKWTSVVLRGPAYEGFGELVAWRATLWDGEKQVAEQKSFLW